jgi:hypothetical protein
VFKFGSEAWLLRKKEEQRLEAAQIKILRHLLGITKLDKEKNQCIRGKNWDTEHSKGRLEFITNLMHSFIYSIIILHHDPQNFSSIAVLLFRRTIVYLQYLVSSHSVCCGPVHRLRADCRALSS